MKIIVMGICCLIILGLNIWQAVYINKLKQELNAKSGGLLEMRIRKLVSQKEDYENLMNRIIEEFERLVDLAEHTGDFFEKKSVPQITMGSPLSIDEVKGKVVSINRWREENELDKIHIEVQGKPIKERAEK